MAHALSEPLPPASPGGSASGSASSGRWSDLGIRLASASVLAPIVLLALWHGGLAWMAVIACTLAGLGAEWARLVKIAAAAWLLPAALLAAMVFALWLGWPAGLLVLAITTPLLAWRCGWVAALGVPYAGLGGLALLWLRLAAPDGLRTTMFLIAVIWATDIGAYAVGRIIGGKKLAPTISPGKTWSGSYGGVFFSGLAGFAITGFSPFALAMAIILSVFAQAGDLMESAIKRHFGVKDSGRTIPGHGGLFDRLDGFLTAAPLAVILALCVHGGLAVWR